MSDNFINHIWSIPGGSVRLQINTSQPLVPSVYEQIGVAVATGDDLVEFIKQNQPPEPLAEWEKELLAASQPQPDVK